MKRVCIGCNTQFEMKTPYCKECRKKLLSLETDIEVSITKHQKGRTQKEKTERRDKDFRKNVLPKMKGWERKYYEKKYGKPL